MRLLLISLDMLVALPLLFAAVSLLFIYAYSSMHSLDASAEVLSETEAMYLNSTAAYNELSSMLALNASNAKSMSLYADPDAYVYNENASQRGCAVTYACRIVIISGNAYVLVFK
jgi:hypothetical protein